MSKAEGNDSAQPLHIAVGTSGQRDVHDPEAGVPIELGEVVTAKLGGRAAVARVIRLWTRKVTPAGTLSAVDVCTCLGCFCSVCSKGQLPMI